MEGLLFIDFGVIVEGTEHDLVAFRELLDLVEGPEFVAFLKRIGYAGE
jgi:hypothetical protein